MARYKTEWDLAAGDFITVRNRFRQAGFTLIELVAVIGLAAVLVAGALAVFGMADSGVKTNALVSQVNAIKSGVKRAFSGQNGYGVGSLTAFVIKAKQIPSDLKVDTAANTITNAWGGQVLVNGDNDGFYFLFGGVPQDVCIQALSMANSGGFDNIATQSFSKKPPLTAADAQAACSAAVNDLWFRSL